MAVTRCPRRRRVLWRLHMFHRVLPGRSMYRVDCLASIVTLPATIAVSSSSLYPFGRDIQSAERRLTRLRNVLPLKNKTDRVGTLGLYSL